MTPAKPDRFDPEVPPPGFEKKLVSFWQERRIISPRLQLVHTNAASRESNVEGAYDWAMRNTEPGFVHGDPPGKNYTTIPTCQIDRDGRGALLLPSNRQTITNAQANSFSLGFETADTGTNADPAISGFTPAQAESVAVCLAYYAWGHGIPLTYPAAWDGTGSACHTEPFGYDKWTISQGKICPGQKKKAQVRDLILPRARQILAAWTTPPPPPPPPDPGDDDVLTPEDLDAIRGIVRAELAAQSVVTPQGARPLTVAVEWIKTDTTNIKAAVERGFDWIKADTTAIKATLEQGGGTGGASADAVADELAQRLKD